MADFALSPLPVLPGRMPGDMLRSEAYDDRAVLNQLSQSNKTLSRQLESFDREKANRRFDSFKEHSSSRKIN